MKKKITLTLTLTAASDFQEEFALKTLRGIAQGVELAYPSYHKGNSVSFNIEH